MGIVSGGGGSGGLAPNSIVLSLSAPLDCRTAVPHSFLWDLAYNNTSDYTVITSVPAALGLSILLNGSSGDVTTTTDGTWAFVLNMVLPTDLTVAGYLTLGNVGLNTPRFGPAVAAVTGAVDSVGITEVLRLPSGALTNPKVVTTVAATSNPWSVTPYLAITRLA